MPTMGALHSGHLSLVGRAQQLCEAVAVSIFVNPLQFNDSEDLANYPRQPEQDRRLLEESGVTMLFMPDREGIYDQFAPRHYELGGLDACLEGASRPGHFQGVVNVVERLFHYVRPDLAIFGEKDRQQLAVINHVARQQHWPVRIVGHPIVREADGLAMSSRNQRLTPADRELAPLLYQALQAMERSAFNKSVDETLAVGKEVLAQAPRIRLDYISIAHPDTLQPLQTWGQEECAALLIAAWVGPVRLIDNLIAIR